jgi:ATP adenylyltransferase
MDRIWAPWRLAYVANAVSTDAKPDTAGACFLCTGLGESDDRKNLIVQRLPRAVTVLNRYPYNNGHLLVAPRAHKGNLADLEAEEILELQQTLERLTRVLDDLMKPEGYNIGLNLGRAAGAGLPGHLHWHLVPRWHGDTNFMPVVGDVKVIAQSLDALWELLSAKLGKE